MKVFIIGTGLIGGSFALDIQQEYSEAIIYGIDTNSRHLKEALEHGVIHKEATMNDLPLADIVFLTIPVDIALAVLPKVLDLISDDALVIDVGSTKQRICDVVKKHPKRSPRKLKKLCPVTPRATYYAPLEINAFTHRVEARAHLRPPGAIRNAHKIEEKTTTKKTPKNDQKTTKKTPKPSPLGPKT